jgi:heme/copper-type cytochrome/quinol oxidase subunit 1
MKKAHKLIWSTISILLFLFAAAGIIGGFLGHRYTLYLESFPPIKFAEYNSGPNVPLLILGFGLLGIGIAITAYVEKRESL